MNRPTFNLCLKSTRKTSCLLYYRKKFFKLFLLVFFVWFCIFIKKASPDGLKTKIGNQTDELARIEKELDEKRKSMEKLTQKERGAFAEFMDLEERLELTERLIKRLAFKEKIIERELQTEERNLKETDWKLCLHREHLHRRLRKIYKHNRFDSYAMIFWASSYVDLINRLRFAKRFLKDDQEMLRATKALKADLEERKQNLGKTKAELFWLKKRESEEQRAYQNDLKERERLLRRIKSEKKLYAQTIGKLEQSVFRMHEILGQLQEEKKYNKIQEPQKKSWFETLRGKLPWPIQGRVLSPFGEQTHPRFHTRTKNSGIDIKTEPGKEVVAVAEGKVIYSSHLRGYGNFLILEHEREYYTLYARLSKILVSPGEEVERLQKIGVVGDAGFSPDLCLHFEIRKGKQPQDPLEWLK